ncbi:hypothetical protein [Glutamicibacter sp. AOP5-A2-18]|uniref:hypothetical protein n=1 Tax=Glutamicibacter sp. AOP5-A2-18 TaxID=3457656 RepID=UPI0040347B77
MSASSMASRTRMIIRYWLYFAVSAFAFFYFDEVFRMPMGALLPPVWESGFGVVGTVPS